MIKFTPQMLKDCEQTATLTAIDLAQRYYAECPGEVATTWVRGSISGFSIWLSTTLGPEKAAEVLYALADEAAARVMTPASQKFLQNRKR